MKLGRRTKGMVLPALILVSLVLLILVSALVSTGTSSLRTATLSQQSDVATYAAEAGLVEAVEEYRRTGKLDAKFKGTVDASGAHYLVTQYSNPTTDDYLVPDGPLIPPSTMYLLSVGTSPNGTTEKAGALFRTGLGVFQTGVVSDSMQADSAKFDAYDSSVDTDPEHSPQSDRGILASKRIDDTVVEPQYALTDTTVDGGVFVAPGSTPANQLIKSGATSVSREGTLATPITVDAIEVPKLSKGGKTVGGVSSESTFDAASYSPGSWRMQDLKVTWNASRQSFVLKDDGGLFGSSKVGEVSLSQLLTASQANPATFAVDDGNGRRVTFDFGQSKITYKDPAGSGKGTWNSTLPAIFADALQPAGTKTENPDSMGPGAYSSVTIDDDSPTVLEEGTYVIGDLNIVGNGQLEVPADKKVIIYVTGQLSAEGENALINNSRLPTSLKMYYTGGKPVNLAGGSMSYMTLVAPAAEIKLEAPDASTESMLYGALVGKSVKVLNAALHFDVATDGVGTGTDGSALSLLNRHRL